MLLSVLPNIAGGVGSLVSPTVSGTATEGQRVSVSSLGSWTGSPTSYAYQWRANGSAISGATLSYFDLTSAQVGATIACLVTASKPGSSASAVSNALGPVAALGTGGAVANQTVTFGALSPSGAIGAKPVDAGGNEVDLTGTPTRLSGPTTHTATVSGGRLTFSGGTGAPDGGVYRCSLAAGGTVDLTVSAVANAYTVGSDTEMSTYKPAAMNAATASGKTIILRKGTYAGGNVMTTRWVGLSAPFTIRGERPYTAADKAAGKADPRPTVTGGLNFGAAASPGVGSVGKARLHDVIVTKTVGVFQSKTTGGMPGSSEWCLHCDANNAADDIQGSGITIRIPVPNSRLTGQRPQYNWTAVWFPNATNVLFTDCDIDGCVGGIAIRAPNQRFHRWVIDKWWDDPMRVNPTTTTPITGAEYLDIHVLNYIGDNGYHPDKMHQFQTGSGSRSIDGVKVRGTVFAPGIEGLLAPAWPVAKTGGAYARDATIHTGTKTLTAADASRFIFIDASTAPGVINLPALSALSADVDMLVQAWFAPTAGLTIQTQGGDTLIDYNAGNAVIPRKSAPNAWAWASYVVFSQRAQNRWVVQAAEGWFQTNFTNTVDLGIKNVDLDFELVWNRGEAVKGTGGGLGSGWRVRNGGYFPPWPPAGGAYDGARPGTPTISQRRSVAFNNSASELRGTVCGPTVTGAGTTQANDTADLNTSWAAMLARTNPPDPAVPEVVPATVAEAILYARPPRADGIGPGLAPVGLEADDHYNFGQHAGEALGLRRTTPWYVTLLTVTPTSGGFSASFQPPTYLEAGAITAYKGRYRVNGGAWTTLTGRTSPWAVSGLGSASRVDVEVLAVNANGDGVWTPAPAITTP